MRVAEVAQSIGVGMAMVFRHISQGTVTLPDGHSGPMWSI